MVRAREQSVPEAARSRRPKVTALSGNKLTCVLQSSQPGSGVPGCVSGDRGEGTSHLPVWAHCLLALAQGWNWVFWSMLCCEHAQKVPACCRLPRVLGLPSQQLGASGPGRVGPAWAAAVLGTGFFSWSVRLTSRGFRPFAEVNCSRLHHHFIRMPRWAHSCPV